MQVVPDARSFDDREKLNSCTPRYQSRESIMPYSYRWSCSVMKVVNVVLEVLLFVLWHLLVSVGTGLASWSSALWWLA